MNVLFEIYLEHQSARPFLVNVQLKPQNETVQVYVKYTDTLQTVQEKVLSKKIYDYQYEVHGFESTPKNTLEPGNPPVPLRFLSVSNLSMDVSHNLPKLVDC